MLPYVPDRETLRSDDHEPMHRQVTLCPFVFQRSAERSIRRQSGHFARMLNLDDLLHRPFLGQLRSDCFQVRESRKRTFVQLAT